MTLNKPILRRTILSITIAKATLIITILDAEFCLCWMSQISQLCCVMVLLQNLKNFYKNLKFSDRLGAMTLNKPILRRTSLSITITKAKHIITILDAEFCLCWGSQISQLCCVMALLQNLINFYKNPKFDSYTETWKFEPYLKTI